MAYIIKKQNREGKYYVYLVESFRVKDKVNKRTLHSFGALEDLERIEPGIFDRLQKEAKAGNLGAEFTGKLTVEYALNEEIGVVDKHYGWQFFDELFTELGVQSVLKQNMPSNLVEKTTKALALLVFQRILDPGSKLYTTATQVDMFGAWQLTENDVYRSLSYFNELKQAIQKQVHDQISATIGRQAYLVFYDVTNYYFETDDVDEQIDELTGEVTAGIRQKGPCKFNSKNPIVQMGLFMDSNGIPISYKLFSGNQTDPITYAPAIEEIKKQFGIQRIIVVADKAMNSKNNVSLTVKNQDGWLFSQKHRGMRGASKAIQTFILDPSGWLFNEQMTFASKSTTRQREVIYWQDDQMVKTEVTEKVLVTWNKKYAIREKKRRDGAIEYAKKLTNAELFRQTSKRGGKKYLEISYQCPDTKVIKPFSPLITFNQEQVDYDEQFDGVNVLVTSEIEMDDDQIISAYGQLSKIEDCFRVTKTELETRPIFVRRQAHIEAHFLTCFLALVFLRVVEHKLNNEYSANKIIKALQSARANELTNGFYRVQASEDLKTILTKLGIDWNKQIVKYEVLKSFAKGWCTTSKK